MNSKLNNAFFQVVKRCFDFLGALVILIILSPLMLYIMYKVSRDGGSAIYGHERVGQNGEKFKCLKFRSMVLNSAEVLEEILTTNEEVRAEWEATFKLKDDPRITKIGHFLRRTSIDELPQLWNVIKGDMSLVGPRPIIEEELVRYGDKAKYYLMTRPGMTGIWQVSGRSDVSYEERVALDVSYVKDWSFWGDIVILFKTISVVFNRSGAY